MAVVRNVAGDARDIPLAGRTVEDGDTFEIDDDVIWQYGWPEDLYEIVDAPPKPRDPDDPPAKSANKPDWVDYAVAQGADRDEAEKLTKDELIETYGQEN